MPTLSEAASKELLGALRRAVPGGAPWSPRPTPPSAAADALGYPVVVKLGGDAIAHKTERGLVRLGLRRRRRGPRRGRRRCWRRPRPRTARSRVLVAPDGAGHPRADRRAARRPAVRHDRDARRRRDPGRGRRRRQLPAGADRARRRRGDDRRPRAPRRCSGPFRGEPAVDRDALVDVLLGLSDAAADAEPDIASADLNPLHRRRTGARWPSTRSWRCGDERPTQRAVPGPVRARGASSSPGASTPPGQVRVRQPPQHPGRRLRGEVFATNRDGAEVLGVQTRGRRRRPARRRGRPRLRVHAGGGQPRPAAGLRREGHPRRLHRLGRLRRGGGGGPAGPGRARRPGRRAGHPAGRAERPGRRVARRSALCAQIVAPYPPAGRIGIASQSGNFVVVVQNYAAATGVGISRAVSAGNAAAVGVRRLPRVLRRRPRDRRRRSPTSRASGDGRAFFERLRARAPRACPVVAGEGRRHRRRASGPRPATPARWPPTTGCSTALCRQAGVVPGRHGRGGLRGGGHVRHPAAARGATGSW